MSRKQERSAFSEKPALHFLPPSEASQNHLSLRLFTAAGFFIEQLEVYLKENGKGPLKL